MKIYQSAVTDHGWKVCPNCGTGMNLAIKIQKGLYQCSFCKQYIKRSLVEEVVNETCLTGRHNKY